MRTLQEILQHLGPRGQDMVKTIDLETVDHPKFAFRLGLTVRELEEAYRHLCVESPWIGFTYNA
jgi:hypothetical protein